MKHTKKITILHSNDLHGDFLAEQVDEILVGGVSMLSGYIEKVRAEQPNTIYVIAGDMFRGSVIDSEYKGLSTIEIMNALAPDIVTIGNHEVDYGIAHLLFIEKCARFPIINANLYIKNTPTRLFTPYKILRMDGMNILFIGIITQDVINQTKSESLVGSFVDTAAAAAEVGKICNAHNSIDIDFTVLLTHIGFEEDRHLARQLDPAWGVDLIIGGHSHTLPEHAVEENGVVIAQAGTGTDQIGRFDIIVDTDNNCIDSYTWHTVPICAETCPRNPAMEQVLHRFTSQVDEKYSHIVAHFRRELTHPERTRETELGNLFADIFTRSLGIDIMLIGSGSIRAEKLGRSAAGGHRAEERHPRHQLLPRKPLPHHGQGQGYRHCRLPSGAAQQWPHLTARRGPRPPLCIWCAVPAASCTPAGPTTPPPACGPTAAAGARATPAPTGPRVLPIWSGAPTAVPPCAGKPPLKSCPRRKRSFCARRGRPPDAPLRSTARAVPVKSRPKL